MKVKQIIAQVRDNLQDANADYWSESELLNLYNECKRHLAAERQENQTSKLIPLIDDTYQYNVDGVLRYISAKDSEGNVRELYPDDGSGDDESSAIIVHNYNLIYVNNPLTGIDLVLKVIAMPSEDNLEATIRSGDENAYKYYMLSKAYEKESDMENFQKSVYFGNMFTEMVKYVKKNAKLNHMDKVRTTKGYYY